MTIASTNSRNDYTGNGAVDTYNYTFRIFDENDLRVIVKDSTGVETVLTITTDYIVTGVGASGGGTVVLVNSGQAWLDGDGDLLATYDITIRRVIDLIQETDIRNQGAFYPEVHEDQFDKLVMADQQQQDEIDRAARMPETIPATVFDPTFPASLPDNPGATIKVNAGGTGFDLGPTADEISNAQGYATAASNSATDSSQHATTASRWAKETSSTVVDADTLVDSGEYSAKEYALGIQTRGMAGKGSAKDWANYTGGTVDGTEYSAKKYAQDAATSESAAAVSAAQAAVNASASLWNDVQYLTNASSPFTITDAMVGTLFEVDCTAGAVTINLPTIAGLTLTGPWSVGIKKTDASTNAITVNRGGTDTIDGATSKTINKQFTGATLVPDIDPAPDKWTSLDFGQYPNLTGSRAVVTDANGYFSASATTATEIGYVGGVTSAIQTQFDNISDSSMLRNLSIAASVGSNALTISLKNKSGSDPSTNSPVVIGFRSSTLTSGVYNTRSVTSSLSLVVSSGSTLGTRSAEAANIYVYAIDNAGTVELAVSRTLVDESALITTVAEGGTGTADSASTVYSTTARTNVSIALIGFIVSSQTTAGTWAASPTKISSGPRTVVDNFHPNTFYLSLGTNQTGVNPNNSTVKVSLASVVNDTMGGVDTTNNRFVCQTDGYYKFDGVVQPDNTNILASRYGARIVINGSNTYVGWNGVHVAGTAIALFVQTPILFLSKNDFVELYIFGSGNNSASTLTLSSGNSWLSGFRLR